MKKAITTILATVFLAASIPTFASNDVINVYVNNQQVNFDTNPEIINDRTFVPLRAIAEVLDFSIEWDDYTQSITLTKGNISNCLQIGYITVINYNNTVETSSELEAAPYIKDNRTMVPIRFISEGFGMQVNWNSDTRSIYITPKSNSGNLLFGDWEENKLIDRLGNIIPNSGSYITQPIYLEADKQYYYKNLSNLHYAFYDTNDNVISSYDLSGYVRLLNPFTAPENTVYARFSVTDKTKINSTWLSLSSEGISLTSDSSKKDTLTITATAIHESPLPTAIPDETPISNDTNTHCNYNGDDICIFEKGLCIGDSLTAGVMNYSSTDSSNNYVTMSQYSYPSYLEKLTSIDITNLGVGGKSSAEWFEQYNNTDLSGYDFAIIQLGINDWYRYKSWSETSIVAFKSIISKLQNENTNIKVFVATIIPAKSYTGSGFDSISQGIRDLVTELSDNNVILIDMAKYGHTNDEVSYNTGHLSAYGYWRLAKDYKSYISWYINTHKSLFSEVQFIGTNYTYGN